MVARVRPLLKNERKVDSIVDASPTTVTIPNPKNGAEAYSFNFHRVYDETASQQDLFDSEGASVLRFSRLQRTNRAPQSPRPSNTSSMATT